MVKNGSWYSCWLVVWIFFKNLFSWECHHPNILMINYLVGGLEHGFYDFPIILGMECHHPNWLSLHFSEGWVNHQPEEMEVLWLSTAAQHWASTATLRRPSWSSNACRCDFGGNVPRNMGKKHGKTHRNWGSRSEWWFCSEGSENETVFLCQLQQITWVNDEKNRGILVLRPGI